MSVWLERMFRILSDAVVAELKNRLPRGTEVTSLDGVSVSIKHGNESFLLMLPKPGEPVGKIKISAWSIAHDSRSVTESVGYANDLEQAIGMLKQRMPS